MNDLIVLEKKTRISLLFDFYGCLLTEKQQEFIQFYYHEDFSLAEIAENFQISRQAVNEHLKRAELLLEEYESKLLLLSKHIQRKKLILQISETLVQSNGPSQNKIYTLLADLTKID